MSTADTHIDVHELSMDEYLDKLRQDISSFETRYRCSSQEMLDALRAGKARETRDVATWLFLYRNLARAEARFGRTTGTPTRTT